MLTNRDKYPTQRYVKFEKLVREKVEGGYYHIPESINSPDRAYDTIIELTKVDRETQEHFGVISLNVKNKVIGCEVISIGAVSSTIVAPRDVFKHALMKGAASIMIFHNHPSGVATPSKEDIDVTERLQRCGELMGITLLDHIIIGDDEYVSMKEKGYM